MTAIHIAIVGASGRMGRMLIEATLIAEDLRLTGACDQPGSASIGQDAGAFFGKKTGVLITDDTQAGLHGAHTVIDFTRPEGTIEHLKLCRQLGVSAVIGTTGFTQKQIAFINEVANDLPIVMAPNMSVGVNVTLKLLELAAKSLKDHYDVEILEMHHKHKVDAPSGTALKMGEVVATAQGKQLADCAVYDRHGHPGERATGSIGFSTARGGDVIGDHTVIFAGTGERIEVAHKSSSRMTYAQGSLMAARFLQDKRPGLYDMFDVIGFK